MMFLLPVSGEAPHKQIKLLNKTIWNLDILKQLKTPSAIDSSCQESFDSERKEKLTSFYSILTDFEFKTSATPH